MSGSGAGSRLLMAITPAASRGRFGESYSVRAKAILGGLHHGYFPNCHRHNQLTLNPT